MRPSSLRLQQSSVRLSELSFPSTCLLVPRTRLVFVHLDNLLSFAMRDRDGKVDAWLAGYLPDEVILLFFRKGEVINAGRIGAHDRGLIAVSEALRRLRSDPERTMACYGAAPMEQLQWMYASCAGPARMRFADVLHPEQLWPVLRTEGYSGVLEFIARGRVHYLRFEDGRFAWGHFCDKPEALSVSQFMASQFEPLPDGQIPPIAASEIPEGGEIPVQASISQVRVYREVYQRIARAVEAELPAEGRRKISRASTTVATAQPDFDVLAADHSEVEPGSPVSSEVLTASLAGWAALLLQDVELVSPGTAERVIRETTRSNRFMLQAAGFYARLPWVIDW
ncbi:MAG: hypothetical protein AB7I33_00915 [Gemmatimonadales bacterium]